MCKVRLFCLLIASFMAGHVSAATIDEFEIKLGGQSETFSALFNGLSSTDFSGFGASDFATFAVSDSVGASVILGFPTAESLILGSADSKFGGSTYEGLFQVEGGSDAATWGDWALVEMSVVGGFGGFGLDGTVTIAEASRVQMSDVSLPSGSVLLLTGLGLIAISRRQKSKS